MKEVSITRQEELSGGFSWLIGGSIFLGTIRSIFSKNGSISILGMFTFKW